MTRTALRTEPPGQLPCGYYGLPPAHFSVLVNPSEREFNTWWRADRAFATVRTYPGRASVQMDTLRAGPMAEESQPFATVACVAALRRMFAVHQSREDDFAVTGPDVWGAFGLLREDALPLALVLVELWWGNPDGCVRLVETWWPADARWRR